jgi:diguanylate cyclase (GGDEF)-like protein
MSEDSAIPPHERRITIGLVADNVNNVSESYIFTGAMAAAERMDANLIYIGHLDNSVEELFNSAGEQDEAIAMAKQDKLLEFVEGFRLDGLLFIGWSSMFDGHRLAAFRDRLSPDYPMLSIGKGFEGLPFVFTEGNDYVEEMTRHLIEVHGCRSIGFVEPWNSDSRKRTFESVLTRSGIDPAPFIVEHSELSAFRFLNERVTKALSILLDDRCETLDAIFLMTMMEGVVVTDELKKRGLRVPEDILVVCYEDDPMIEYAEPPMTAVYYPFQELGYAACERLVRRLQGQFIADDHHVPGQIIYRDSCGCTVNKIKPVPSTTQPSEPQIGNGLEYKARVKALASKYERVGLDLSGLAELFLEQLDAAGTDTFLANLRHSLKLTPMIPHHELQGMIDEMRLALLPIVAANEQTAASAELLWHAARIAVKDHVNEARLMESFSNKDRYQILEIISHRLLSSSYTIASVMETLNRTLGWIGIQTNFILLDNGSTLREKDLRLIFGFMNGVNHVGDYKHDRSLGEVFLRYETARDSRYALLAMPLYVNSEYKGVIFMEPGSVPISLLISLGTLVSTALRGAMLLEESQSLIAQLSEEIILRKEKERELAIIADTDPLTRLFNRRFFYRVVSAAVEQTIPFAVLYVDIDGFKAVNDTLGHDIGDELLIQIASRLTSALKKDSYPIEGDAQCEGADNAAIFRLGGDEFTAMLAETSPNALQSSALELIDNLRAPYRIGDSVIHISASIGIGVYPTDATDALSLIRCSDQAMYRAKEKKNTFVFYNGTDDERMDGAIE